MASALYPAAMLLDIARAGAPHLRPHARVELVRSACTHEGTKEADVMPLFYRCARDCVYVR